MKSHESRTVSPRRRARWVGALLAGSLLPVAVLFADSGSQREPLVLRFERERAERPHESPAPPTGMLPEVLRLRSVEASTSVAPHATGPEVAAPDAPGRAVRTRRPEGAPVAPAPHAPGLDEAARQAARWTAEELSRTVGRREYYRVGAWDGLRTALDDTRPGLRDRRSGLRRGGRDPRALDLGADIGREAARDAARDSAAAEVAEQFRDLTREPVFAPRVRTPAFHPQGSHAAPPRLEEVFADFPPHAVPGVPDRLGAAFAGWRLDPWNVYRCGDFGEFFDAAWAEPGAAFRFWRDHGRRARIYDQLGPEPRRRFREVFRAELESALPGFFEPVLLGAYDRGFEHGWRYGAFVHAEWHYRLGYHEGFDRAVVASALTSFQVAFPRAYERSYDRVFREWSENPKPAILGVRLLDGNDDGIFEPGEPVLVRFELANYGGRAGTFSARLAGRALADSGARELRLPARAMVWDEAPLRASLRSGIAPRTRAELRFEVAGLSERLPIEVSYPLELAGGPEFGDIDALRGRATVRARVINRSRKPVRGAVHLSAAAGTPGAQVRGFEGLAPGASQVTRFELVGLRPLDVLAGRVEVRLDARSRGAVHDTARGRLPDLSVDLGNRELMRFLVALSDDPDSPAADIAAARSLLLRRLRVDWREAVRGRGNPYRHDFKRRGSRTALGELVRTARTRAGHAVRPEVFAGLDEEVRSLARELPGAHPFLRKYVKRLARRLG